MNSNNYSQMTIDQARAVLQSAEQQVPTSLNLSRNWPFFLGVILVLYLGFVLWTNDYMSASVTSVICGLLLLTYIYFLVNTNYTPKIPMGDCPDFFVKDEGGANCIHISTKQVFPIHRDRTDEQRCDEAEDQNISWQACYINKEI
jgi:TRAP-type uncharacterized transport system fused permease subunit